MGTGSDAAESGAMPPIMRFLKLLGQILIWIADGKRNLEHMLRLLQLVNDRPDFVAVLDTTRSASLRTNEPSPDFWSKFLEMMISACGFVSYVNQNINGKNFPYQDGDLEPKQVETLSIKQRLRELCRQTMTTQEVKDYIAAMGYRSATLVELLWWWLKNPAKHTNCLVFALGSVWDGDVPCVYGYGSRRKLDLDSTVHGWDGHCSFAVVRKLATP